jgi:hypothetical protein
MRIAQIESSASIAVFGARRVRHAPLTDLTVNDRRQQVDALSLRMQHSGVLHAHGRDARRKPRELRAHRVGEIARGPPMRSRGSYASDMRETACPILLRLRRTRALPESARSPQLYSRTRVRTVP